MAANYTLNSVSASNYSGRYLQLTASQTKDIPNRRSLINWTLTVIGSNSSASYWSTGPTTLNMSGQRYYKDRVSWSSYIFPAGKAGASTSGSFYINHDSNGDASIPCSITTAIYTETLSTTSGTWTLDSIGPAFVAPSWSSYNIQSFPSTAYVNMPYNYTVGMSCSYGSSTSNNLLYFEGYRSNSNSTISFYTFADTTGTSISTVQRSVTFNRTNMGAWNCRGVIKYTNSSGMTSYISNSILYPLTVSFLNPTLTGVSHSLNNVNLYRTSIVTSTTSATYINNSADSRGIYSYFNAPDATGDGSGQGSYYLGNNSLSGATASYIHLGTNTGTFVSRVNLNGTGSDGNWVGFGSYGELSYTMHPFVEPTATGSIAYVPNNMYNGQIACVLDIDTTATNKSPYDTLETVFWLDVIIDDVPQDLNFESSFQTGSKWVSVNANRTLNTGEKVKFSRSIAYYDVDNQLVSRDTIYTAEYTVIPMPIPQSEEVQVTLSVDRNNDNLVASVSASMNTDLYCSYTLFIENEDGDTVYKTFVDTVDNGFVREHTYKYNEAITQGYRARIECKYITSLDGFATSDIATFYSNVVYIYAGPTLNAKIGDTVKEFHLKDESCLRPRLAVKNGDSIMYIPINKTNGSGVQLIKKDGYSTDRTDNTFWTNISTTATPLEDGWMHCEYTNNTGSLQYVNAWLNIDAVNIEPDNTYKIQAELRNVVSSGGYNIGVIDAYQDSQAFLDYFIIAPQYINEGYQRAENIRTKDSFEGVTTSLRTVLGVQNGETINLDIRISVFSEDGNETFLPYVKYIDTTKGLNLKNGGTTYCALQIEE